MIFHEEKKPSSAPGHSPHSLGDTAKSPQGDFVCSEPGGDDLPPPAPAKPESYKGINMA